MESETYIKTIKRDDAFFDVYQIVAPLGEVLVEEDNELVNKMSYSSKEEEKQVEYQNVKIRYDEYISERNDYITNKEEKLEEINGLEEELEDIDKEIGSLDEQINYYESTLINEDDKAIEEVSEEL